METVRLHRSGGRPLHRHFGQSTIGGNSHYASHRVALTFYVRKSLDKTYDLPRDFSSIVD